jgi:hypothetical protein
MLQLHNGQRNLFCFVQQSQQSAAIQGPDRGAASSMSLCMGSVTYREPTTMLTSLKEGHVGVPGCCGA